jgi:hypothetical protein
MSHFVGLGVQAPSMPLVIVSSPLPLPKAALPAEALLLERGGLGLGADQGGIAGAVALAEGVARRR